MLLLFYTPGTEDRTNETISFSRFVMAEGRNGSVQKKEAHISHHCELLLQIYRCTSCSFKLDNTSAGSVILRCKNIFSWHGIPKDVVTDNGPQFDSNAFRKFAQEYQFCHITSSLHYPRGNEQGKCGVKTIKELLKKSNESHLALLAYRSTPIANGYAPAELLISRKLRTNISISREAWRPRVPDKTLLADKEEELRRIQKCSFDR